MTLPTAHEQMVRHLELALKQPLAVPSERIDVSFLHRSFCIAGLPIKQRKEANYSVPIHLPASG
jgi:hypothetical protein